MQDVVLLAQILNRPEEAQSILQEGRHHTQCQSARLHAEPAIRQDAGQRQHRDEFDHWIKPAVGGDGVLVCLHMLAIDHFEIARGALFAIEKL